MFDNEHKPQHKLLHRVKITLSKPFDESRQRTASHHI